MKLLFIGLFTAWSSIISAQNPSNQPFLGTWEYQNGDKLFRINIWESANQKGIHGHYWLYEVDDNGNRTLIDLSNKPMIEGSTNIWPYALAAGSSDGVVATGSMYDVTPIPKDITYIHGFVKMRIEPGGQTARWIVQYEGMIFYDARFQIPTNVTLTKVG